MEKIKPCPFCGGEARLFKDSHGNHAINCEVCYCRTAPESTKQVAIQNWNGSPMKKKLSAKAKPTEKVCRWIWSNYFRWYDLSCGESISWRKIEVTRDFKFCPYCGLKIEWREGK